MDPWTAVESLVAEQKFQQALEATEKIRLAAVDDAERTRALVREAQLLTSLHGYERTVRFLREQDWPEEPRSRLLLGLFYGRSLATYLRAYQWEIVQREKVGGDDASDLTLWTADQIRDEIERAYGEVWSHREAWGETPVQALKEYIDPNDYPSRIRGTLRDAVTYLWVETLTDSFFWGAGQANRLYLLEMDSLLADGEPVESSEALADDALHPLEKTRRILGDLEAWHREREEPEAALEARLALIRKLSAAFSRPEEKQVLRRHLEERLEAFDRDLPWWTVGRCELAVLVRHMDFPEALIEARALAEEGAEAHPKTRGAARCRQIVQSIEAPSFQWTAMAVDGPNRRSLEFNHANLEKIFIRAYSLDLRGRAGSATGTAYLPRHREVEALLKKGTTPAAEWSVDLPRPGDYRVHRTFDTPPLEAIGSYLLVASARADFALDDNLLTALFFQRSDLYLKVGEAPDDEKSFHVHVRSGRSGEAQAGVELALYGVNWRQPNQLLGKVRSDEDGFASLNPEALRPSTSKHSPRQYLLEARRGNDLVVYDRALYLPRRTEPKIRRSALIYTDRSVYRPGQEILFKVVAFEQSADGRTFETLAQEKVTLDLRDANGESVAEMDLTTNDMGSAAGRFAVPAGRLLGSWQLQTNLNAAVSLRVEEYKRPTFKVEIDDSEEPARLNREVTLRGHADYYFGLPLADAEMVWRVTREPVYRWSFWRPAPVEGTRIVASGESRLDGDGKFEVRFTPEADERLAQDQSSPFRRSAVSYRYRLVADVTEAGGETRTGEKAFTVGFVAVAADFRLDTAFFREGGPAELTVVRTHLDGKPLAGHGTFTLTRLVQPESVPLPADLPPLGRRPPVKKFQSEGDLLRPRWQTDDYSPMAVLALWDDGAEVASGELEHGEDGVARIPLQASAGAYRLTYRTADDFGAELVSAKEFLVTGEDGLSIALPGLLLAERQAVEVGQSARFLVGSGLPGQRVDFLVTRHGSGTEQRSWIGDGRSRLVEIPVTESDRGGLGVAYFLVRDHQPVGDSASLSVPWDNRRLDLELTTFRDELYPGGKETWRVTLKNPEGHAVARDTAELLAYMYDKSLELFAPHRPPEPGTLLPGSLRAPRFLDNLGQAQSLMYRDRGWRSRSAGGSPWHGDTLTFLDGYGAGGPGVRFRGGSPRAMAMASPPAPVAKRMAVADAEAVQNEVIVTAEAPLVEIEESSAAYDGGADSADEPPELRENFAETAFWYPHLLLDDDGGVSFEFTVPDSVTEWDLWIHALTRGLRFASLRESVHTVKDLLVRPYLPRFFREGDRAELRVVVSNAGDEPLNGTLDFDIYRPATAGSPSEGPGTEGPPSEESLLSAFGLTEEASHDVPFTVEPGRTETLVFPVTAPREVGPVAVRALGRSGRHSDGELRPLPVLPSRLYLSQSRFTALQGPGEKTLRFDDLANAASDPTLDHESLIVTLDAQLFYAALGSLPYLVSYPYDCSEQILNRFVPAGILASLFERYPGVAEMAKKLAAERDTPLESWEAEDPNRRMLLEESPWLNLSRGGKTPDGAELLKVLDPDVADAQRRVALRQLEEIQLPSGAFPWWSGGPPSPYVTLYVLEGLSRALEYDVQVPREMVRKAWSYVGSWWHLHWEATLADRVVRHPEASAYLAWVLSRYPDASWTGEVFSEEDVERMIGGAYKDWKKLSPRIKGYLALVLNDRGRAEDAAKVWESVMDSARTDERLGTYWAPEDRAWLWYNDTVETHAFALRVLTELHPDDPRRAGLVQWLMLDKKLGHWKSTRATAEAIYALVKYLESEGVLGVTEDATVTVGHRKQSFLFRPDTYTGARNRVVVDGPEVTPRMASIEVKKTTPGTLFASATWHFATERLPETGDGDLFRAERRFFRRTLQGEEWVLEPLEDGATLEVGDPLEIQLTIRALHQAEFVHLRDPRGAGFEPEDPISGYRWDLGIGHYREIRDSGTNFFFDRLPVGEYVLKYRVRAATAGTFRVGPATLQSLYAPEFTAYSSGRELKVEAR